MGTNFRKRALIIADILIIFISFFIGLLLKSEFVLNNMLLLHFRTYILLISAVYLVTFFVTGLYNNMWAYASIREYTKVFYANIIAFIICMILDNLFINNLSFTVLVMGALFALVLTEGIRILYRIIVNKEMSNPSSEKYGKEKKNVIIMGAGKACKLLINEIINNPNLNYNILGMVDDDPGKLGQSISGYSVLGTITDTPRLVNELNAQEVIFAIPSMSNEEKKNVLNSINNLNATKVKLKTLPNISEIINKGLDIKNIRNVEITDLLGRKEISMDKSVMLNYIEDKTVMVTGGGGSIGSELCRQIASFNPKKLIIVDIYENNAYDIEMELKEKYRDLNLLTLIASVRDRTKVFELVKEIKPDIIFHAAAHKHVPLMEVSPAEAVKNNVFGTLNIVQAAVEYGVSRFVLISTDKAVNPTNAMGATKRLCEMIIQTYNSMSDKNEFVAVRFGNVLGSNGSVIPLFKKQIEHGGPITLTHKDITRFFMTIPEAVQLVLTAGSMAKGGEIFVLDMGEPVKIYDLARNLIKLSGLEPDVDIKINITGLRPGEKLYEELLMAEEGLQKTSNDLIYIGKPNEFNWSELLAKLNKLKEVAENPETTNIQMKEELARIVDTYHIDRRNIKF